MILFIIYIVKSSIVLPHNCQIQKTAKENWRTRNTGNQGRAGHKQAWRKSTEDDLARSVGKVSDAGCPGTSNRENDAMEDSSDVVIYSMAMLGLSWPLSPWVKKELLRNTLLPLCPEIPPAPHPTCLVSEKQLTLNAKNPSPPFDLDNIHHPLSGFYKHRIQGLLVLLPP